LFRETYA